MMIPLFLFFLFAFASAANVPGLDVSQPVSRTVADCFVRSGYKYLLIRAWFCVNGGVDNNAVTTYNSLRAAGMQHVGFYIFPCVGRARCTSATAQVNSVKQFIDSNNMRADSVWLDIEGGGSCPWGDVATNKNFYVEMLAAAKAAWPDRYGVYSSRYMWETLFGSRSWINPGDDKLKLWYAHYDKQPNFDTFLTFSSWPTKTSPYAKQYDGNVNTCNFNVDLNTAPEFFGITSNGMVPPPPAVITSCKFNGVSGVCAATADCPEPKQWVASAAGATGCQLLPNEIRCCVAADSSPATACTFSGAAGSCMPTATCLAANKQSVPSVNGAMGCESLPADVRCCIDPKATVVTSVGASGAVDTTATTTTQKQQQQPNPTTTGAPRTLDVVDDSLAATSAAAERAATVAAVLAAAAAAI